MGAFADFRNAVKAFSEKQSVDVINDIMTSNDNWSVSTEEPTFFEKLTDKVTDFAEKVGDVFADYVQDNYGVDIPDYGSDEFSADDVPAENSDGSSFSIMGLVVPASIIGLLFLL